MNTLRHSLRQLARSPGLMAAAALTFAPGLPAAGGVEQTGKGWSKLADMPAARLYAGAAALHGKLYVIGGCVVRDGEVVPVDAVEEYSPETGAWQRKASLPTARSSFGIAVASDRIFVIGGTRTDTLGAVDTVEAYDPVSDRWTTAAQMPTPRSQVGAAMVGGKIYAVGGNTGHERAFEAYDPVIDQWSVLPPLPAARRNAGVAAVGGRLFVVGGVTPDGWTPVGALDEYEPATGRWTARPDAPTARTDLAIAGQEGQIVVIGGFNRRALAVVEAYDPVGGSWTTRPDLPAPVQLAAAASLEGRIFVAGGTSKLPGAAAALLVSDAAATPAPAATMIPVPAKPPFTLGRRSGRFTLYAAAVDEQALTDVADALQRHAPQVCRDLQCDYRRPVTVELFPDQGGLDRDERSRGTRGHYAHSDGSGIQMVSPRNPLPGLPLDYQTRTLIAVHEFAHLVNNEVNPRMPLWLNEGAAVFVGPHAPYAHVCRTGFPFDRVPSLRALQESYSAVPAADLFAYSFVEFVTREHGLEVLNRLLRSPDSLEKLLGATREEIERRWRNFMEKHYVPALSPAIPPAATGSHSDQGLRCRISVPSGVMLPSTPA